MKHTLRAIALGLLLSPLAAGQSDTNVTAARQIARQGLEAYDAGRYDEAADKLSRAYEVVKLPTLALHTARALVRAGKLVEASEIYLQATRLEARGEFQAEQERAQQDAARERAELVPRIPTVVVQVEGAPPNEVTVTVDGREVPMALLGGGYVVNPGTRALLAQHAGRSVSEQVVLAEGERKSVVLRFAPQPEASAVAPADAPASPLPTLPPPPVAAPARTISSVPAAADTGSDGSVQRSLGWVGLGIGGAGLIFGSVTGIAVGSKKSELDAGGCVDGGCYPHQADDVDSYNQLRTLSTIGFVVGVVGATTGATLLLTAPDPEPTTARVHGWIGVGSVGVAGRY